MAGKSMKTVAAAVYFLVFCVFLLFILSCTKATAPQPAEVSLPRIELAWEKNHPERAAWSDAMRDIIYKDFAVFSAAKDLYTICPNIESLSHPVQVQAIAEFFVAIAYHESGYNPKSASVDVGTKRDLGSWSVGLFQMSGNDRSAKKFGYDFEKLKEPIPNIEVAMEQFRKQIISTGLYILPNSNPHRYWATILTGNRYSQLPDILSRVKKLVPGCK